MPGGVGGEGPGSPVLPYPDRHGRAGASPEGRLPLAVEAAGGSRNVSGRHGPYAAGKETLS